MIDLQLGNVIWK